MTVYKQQEQLKLLHFLIISVVNVSRSVILS